MGLRLKPDRAKRCKRPSARAVKAEARTWASTVAVAEPAASPLQDQGVTDHHAGHAGIALCKLQQHEDDASRVVTAVTRALGDLVEQGEETGLDEFDEPFEHLRLAREVAVQGRFADLQACRQGRRGDAVGVGLLQHRSQGLQNLDAALTGTRSLARCACNGISRGVFRRRSGSRKRAGRLGHHGDGWR